MIGFLNVYKPSGVTSNFVVQKIKKKFHIKKIGHLGTLDPLASGVLPIAIGKATRLFDYSLNKSKTYIATFDFGYTTDTLDKTGDIVESDNKVPTKEELLMVIPTLCGEVDQVPPNFSAKNINGERAYNLARKGVDFELQPKRVKIHNINYLEQVGENSFRFEIECSSGTYIRSIARDMGTAVKCVGCMSALERIITGNFTKESAILLDDLLETSNLDNVLISPQDAFPNIATLEIDKTTFEDLINGKQVNSHEVNVDTFILYNNCLVGLAKPSANRLKLDVFLYEEDDKYD